jgi:hypothetical protein
MQHFRTLILGFSLLMSALTTGVLAQPWPNESVLRKGVWAEVRVLEDGVYRLKGSELQQLGLGTLPIASSAVGVWGRNAGVMSEVNAGQGEARDLSSLPIRIDDGGDGQIHADDAIYFLGQAPHVWNYDAPMLRWLRTTHSYSDHQTYFVTSTEGGTAMATYAPSVAAPQPTNRYVHLSSHELDVVNLVGSGRMWMGEVFDYTLSRDFDLGLNRLDDQSTARFTLSAAGRTTVFGPKLEVRSGQGFVGSMSFQTVSGVSGDTYARWTSQSWNQVGGTAPWGTLNLTLERSANPAASAWLDAVSVYADAPMAYQGGMRGYRFEPSVTGRSLPQPPAGTRVWRTGIQNQVLEATEVPLGVSPVLEPGAGHTLWYFTPESALTPQLGAVIPNQNLHSLTAVDYVIYSPAEFITAAERLAEKHRSEGLRVEVLDVAKVYREFSGGVQDIMGLRNALRMLWTRNSDTTSLKYLLLFGDASYDYKGKLNPNQNWVPAYQSPSSMAIKTSFVSDDFFGFLDDGEGGFLGLTNLDLGIGRLPVNSLAEADAVVQKLLRYADPNESLGPWRQKLDFVSDDVDVDWEQILTLISDRIAVRVDSLYPQFNVNKLYADAYVQVSSAGNQSYPKLREDLLRSIQEGNLITTYMGHGGEVNWASEDILQLDDCKSFTNGAKLPLFITVTCEFSRYDDPLRTSAGEHLITNPLGGAVAMLTTTRAVFVGGATLLTDSIFNKVLEREQGQFKTFGQIIKSAKNSVQTGDKLRFTLLGDPAMRLNGPKQGISFDSVEIYRPASGAWQASDSLRALDLVRVRGRITHESGATDSAFQGSVRIQLFDKSQLKPMLDNDNVGYQTTYAYRNQRAYQGSVDVEDGRFTAEWRMPLDLVLDWGKGKLSAYAATNETDAAGALLNLFLGDLSNDAPLDATGPTIRVFMDDTSFVSGGITGPDPLGLVRLMDPNGINALGTGIGHDLVGYLDEDWSRPLVMNDRYQADPNTYQRGTASWPFQGLSDGNHTFTVRAWDTYNNPSQSSVDFTVVSRAQLQLGAVRLFPNPSPGTVHWQVEHNASGDSLAAYWSVSDGSGRVVWAHQWSGMATSSVLTAPDWLGTDPSGRPLPNGWYTAHVVVVRRSDGQVVRDAERLILLRP